MQKKHYIKLALNKGQPVRENMLVFQQPHLTKAEIAEVVDTLKSGWIGNGPKVSTFEQKFTAFKKAHFGLALNSCTSALFLALKTLDLKQGDEVITTPMTFAATANVIENIGSTTVFADCDSRDFNILPEKIVEKISPRTKAVVAVHFAGRPCRMDEIVKICRKYKLILIEDCAHAVESSYHGKPVGLFGSFGCFSFYATKNLFMGEGGMLITNNRATYKKALLLANHGMQKDAWRRYVTKVECNYFLTKVAGYKMNMTDIQAAIGLHQLKALQINRKKRKEVWDFYNKHLQGYPVTLPLGEEKDTQHAFHLYSMLLNLDELKCTRDVFAKALQKENIGIGINYIPLHVHPYYKEKYKLKPHDYPNAFDIGSRVISLNIKPTLKKKDLRDILNGIDKICHYYRK